MEDFEDKLNKMTKPEIVDLSHQNILANTVIRAKDKSVLSMWWLSVPLYIIAALLMKTFFMPNTTLISNIHDLANKDIILSILFFVAVPIGLIVLNIRDIKKVHFLLGNPKTISFFGVIWINILTIVFSVLIIVIYSL